MENYASAIVADFHTHTHASSHAYSSLHENLTMAAARGLLALAMTDHGVGIEDAPHLWHFKNQDCLPASVGGVRLLSGVEANVMGFDGHLDMSADVLETLDIVIASMHRETMPEGSVEEVTAAWEGVVKNPLVDILGHCGTARYRFDYERLISLAGQYGKVIEINENTFFCRKDSLPGCREILRLCKRHGVRITVDSDAHFYTNVGLVPHCLAMLREEAFPVSLVVNATRENLAEFFREKGIEWINGG